MARGIIWSLKEDQFVRDYYDSKTDLWLSEKLGRTIPAVQVHRNKMGLECLTPRDRKRKANWDFRPKTGASIYTMRRKQLFMAMIQSIPRSKLKANIDMNWLITAFAAVENIAGDIR